MNGYGTVLQGLPGRRPVHPARGARAEVEGPVEEPIRAHIGPAIMVRRTSLASPQSADREFSVLMIDRPLRDEHLAWECAHAA